MLRSWWSRSNRSVMSRSSITEIIPRAQPYPYVNVIAEDYYAVLSYWLPLQLFHYFTNLLAICTFVVQFFNIHRYVFVTTVALQVLGYRKWVKCMPLCVSFPMICFLVIFSVGKILQKSILDEYIGKTRLWNEKQSDLILWWPGSIQKFVTDASHVWCRINHQYEKLCCLLRDLYCRGENDYSEWATAL